VPARVHTVIVDRDHRNAAHNFAYLPLQALGQELRGEDRPLRCALPGPAQITRRTVSEPSTICLALIGWRMAANRSRMLRAEGRQGESRPTELIMLRRPAVPCPAPAAGPTNGRHVGHRAISSGHRSG